LFKEDKSLITRDKGKSSQNISYTFDKNTPVEVKITIIWTSLPAFSQKISIPKAKHFRQKYFYFRRLLRGY
jgi:hypothetical protein